MTLRLHSVLFAALLGSSAVWAAPATEVEVFRNPQCGCCGKWTEHLKQNGFHVTTHEAGDLPAARKKLGMPDSLASCHTARIGGYVVEGHVPAGDIRRLLKDKPKALGLAVPSMVPGSPGMETGKPVHYETLLVVADGSTRIFARH